MKANNFVRFLFVFDLVATILLVISQGLSYIRFFGLMFGGLQHVLMGAVLEGLELFNIDKNFFTGRSLKTSERMDVCRDYFYRDVNCNTLLSFLVIIGDVFTPNNTTVPEVVGFYSGIVCEFMFFIELVFSIFEIMPTLWIVIITSAFFNLYLVLSDFEKQVSEEDGVASQNSFNKLWHGDYDYFETLGKKYYHYLSEENQAAGVQVAIELLIFGGIILLCAISILFGCNYFDRRLKRCKFRTGCITVPGTLIILCLLPVYWSVGFTFWYICPVADTFLKFGATIDRLLYFVSNSRLVQRAQLLDGKGLDYNSDDDYETDTDEESLASGDAQKRGNDRL